MCKKSKSSKNYSQSADLIGGNEYLIGKILPCLPARSLIRFKIVSKQWHSLISDPRFGLNHTLQNSVSRIPSGFLFRNSLTGAKKFDFDSVSISKLGGKIPSFPNPIVLPADDPIRIRNVLPASIPMQIVQSCNGLVLFEFYLFDKGIKLYCVRNLATKQQRFVPSPNFEDPQRIGATCFLAFDPSVSPHYKLVGMKYDCCGYNMSSKFMIFSSETGQWKHINVTVTAPQWTVRDVKGVYCKGSIYWIAHEYGGKTHCYGFDVEAESLMEISLPRKPGNADSGYYFRYFGEFNGHLNLVYVRSASAKKFNVLELDEVTKNWFIKYRVHINHLISPFPEIVLEGENKMSKYAFSILSVARGEKEEDSALIMTIPGKVVSYNFRSKKVDVLSEFPQSEIKMYFDYASAYPFVASLYPLCA